jgi:K+-transporting ATPase ATPase C chain
MKTLLKPAVLLFGLLTLLTGALYPLAITAAAQVFFPHQANGSLIERNGQVIGSELIGQNFSAPRYFWGRPSATSGSPCNAAASGGSNLGPGNPALAAAVAERIAALRAGGAAPEEPVPVDLVTASGSGLDPHISIAAAKYQVERVARARNLESAAVGALVERLAVRPLIPGLSEARVNVLSLNLALDAGES